MDINEVFGKKVLERRLSLKISQETLANMADIDRTYLPDIEKGKKERVSKSCGQNRKSIECFT